MLRGWNCLELPVTVLGFSLLRCYAFQPWRLEQPLLPATRGQECTPLSEQLPTPWFFSANSWTCISLTCIYVPAALVEAEQGAPLALPFYLRRLNRTG